jgi:hypothetical protein
MIRGRKGYRSSPHHELQYIVQNATKAASQLTSHCYAKVMMEELATHEASCVRTTVVKPCSLARYHNAPFSMTRSACHACTIRQKQRRQTSKQLDK